jgi:hypothetical protein
VHGIAQFLHLVKILLQLFKILFHVFSSLKECQPFDVGSTSRSRSSPLKIALTCIKARGFFMFTSICLHPYSALTPSQLHQKSAPR